MTDILICPAMIENCNNWRSRVVPEGYLCDVYDGKVWNDFVANGFFDEGNNIALMMNCDWFQPYKLTQYSVGVFYFVIMNLPRNIRFKRENLIIAGVIPGPTEPSYREINFYLKPLVDDLLDLWYDGLKVVINAQEIHIRAALLCVASDIPAARKMWFQWSFFSACLF